jgi:glycosyltransferase involved in cell wall biosynthesis
MACGLPVVCSRIAGLEELVVAAGAGIVVPVAEPAALAAGLRQLLADDAMRAECGRRGRALVEGRYDFRRVSEQLGWLYRELATP